MATSAVITTSTATSTTDETGVLPTQTATQEYQERLTAWTRKAKKARSIIGSSISASSMVYVEGIDNPAEMWRILSERFNSITKIILLQIIKEFITINMNEMVDMMEIHLQRIQRLKRHIEK